MHLQVLVVQNQVQARAITRSESALFATRTRQIFCRTWKHVRKREISRERITALTQYVDKGDHRNLRPVEKESGEGKTPFFKCPLCELVTAYLPTHFANKHKIPRSSEQSGRYMAFARAYEGGEELKYIERTRPSRKMTSVTDARGIECLLQVPLLD